ncbi:hypothetical protein [Thalassomonas sp. M1454]|uniref:hypothetical protein n=1 Tax=Thalassomonas sp. M1454 TaxID=2594477 RepID=UPI00163D9587|nr:hypothetical protein [Thalassomonas sp. M1454]
MSLRVVVIILLSLLLSTSSFSLLKSLDSFLSSAEYKLAPEHYTSQYLLGLSLGLDVAQYQHIREVEHGSKKWQKLATNLARNDADIAWQLSQYYKLKQQQRNYQYWFDKAAELGSVDALITNIENKLAAQPQQKQYLEAKRALSELLDSNDDALILSTHLAIEFNDLEQLSHNIRLLKSDRGKHLRQLINRYRVLPSQYHLEQPANSLLSKANSSSSKALSCDNKIQFFATSIPALSKLEQQIALLSVTPFYSQKFCFSTPRFISKAELKCSHSDEQRIQCDESIWQDKALEPDIKYLGVLVEKGGANVNHGILYIDEQDSQQVVEHELMHLIGYVDEYPLHASHNVCLASNDEAIANNVIKVDKRYYNNETQARAILLAKLPWRNLIASDTPLTTPVTMNNTTKYKVGTPMSHKQKVGLFPTNTCNNHEALTFKPVSIATKLEYFEQSLPDTYQQLSFNAADKFNMPSYQYNIGLSLLRQEQGELAQQWFVESAKLETDQRRQKVISQGGF